MSEGYPDYARLARTGQYQLFTGNNVTPAYDVPFFKGYVGNFPFVNFFTSMAASADIMHIAFAWYSDSTFLQQIAFRIANRQGGAFAVTQYANLSDWLAVFYTTKSGNPMGFQEVSLYGTQQPAGQYQLTSMDVPLLSIDQNIAATSTDTIQPQHIQPGPAIFDLFTGAVSWFVNFNYYDFGSGTFKTYFGVTHNAFPNGTCSLVIPCLDTPIQVAFTNQDAGAQPFTGLWHNI